jgi:hypothetical protein
VWLEKGPWSMIHMLVYVNSSKAVSKTTRRIREELEKSFRNPKNPRLCFRPVRLFLAAANLLR